jgi:hypothetical protein
MYERYAELQGWKVEVISASEGTMGGYKEIIAEVRAAALRQAEIRIRRAPRAARARHRTQGRIHTSAATVAVLPEVEEVDVDINDDLQDRHHARRRRRRPARQQDRIGDPHHPHADRHRRDDAGGAARSTRTAPRR